MLARYRAMAADRPWDWGKNRARMPFSAVQMVPRYVPDPLSRSVNGRPELLRAALGELSVADALLAILDASPSLPAGTSVVDLAAGDGHSVRTGPAPYVIKGAKFEHVLVVRGRPDRETVVDAG